MPQKINPKPFRAAKPTAAVSKPHPHLGAPPGTPAIDPASCLGPNGELPWVAIEILDDPVRGKPGGGVSIQQVSAEWAAERLAWTPPGDPKVRLATDEEIAAVQGR